MLICTQTLILILKRVIERTSRHQQQHRRTPIKVSILDTRSNCILVLPLIHFHLPNTESVSFTRSINICLFWVRFPLPLFSPSKLSLLMCSFCVLRVCEQVATEEGGKIGRNLLNTNTSHGTSCPKSNQQQQRGKTNQIAWRCLKHCHVNLPISFSFSRRARKCRLIF